MFIQILEVIACLAILPFGDVFIVSLFIVGELNRAKLARGVGDWSKVALVRHNGSIQPASGLVQKFKKSVYAVLASIILIGLTFAITRQHPEMVNDVEKFKLFSYGFGLVAGVLMSAACIVYGNLVKWNFLGVSPPQK